MATIYHPAHKPDEEPQRGGPIGALVIAIPVSLLLWAVVVLVLLTLVH